MVPEGTSRPYGRVEPGRRDNNAPSSAEVRPAASLLTIRLAWAAGGFVEGVLDAYWDPDRATAASTIFRGHVESDRIEGTFVTEYANRAPSTSGTWSVRRR